MHPRWYQELLHSSRHWWSQDDFWGYRTAQFRFMHQKQHDSCRTAMAEATLRTRMDQVKLIFSERVIKESIWMIKALARVLPGVKCYVRGGGYDAYDFSAHQVSLTPLRRSLRGSPHIPLVKRLVQATLVKTRNLVLHDHEESWVELWVALMQHSKNAGPITSFRSTYRQYMAAWKIKKNRKSIRGVTISRFGDLFLPCSPSLPKNFPNTLSGGVWTP